MLKSKIFINVLLVMTILFCFHLNHNSIAGDCDDMTSGGGTPTVTGDHNIPENWNPGLQFDPNNPDEIDRNSSIHLNVVGGCLPYTFSVGGNGFSMTDNTLFADETACGTATIIVTDACGNNATGYVRCTTGSWGSWTNGCVISGEPDSSVKEWGVLTLEKTKDKYFQQQQVRIREYSIDGCDNENCAENCGYSYCMDAEGCTDCLEWDCDDFDPSGTRPTCQAWCCGSSANPIGSCEYAGRCMCNATLRYREWGCP